MNNIDSSYKLIIAGGRDFNDYTLLKKECDKVIANIKTAFPLRPIEIVSGKARGADSLGEKYALEKGFPVTGFLANWDLYGKSAGYKRNLQMAEYSDELIAFHDKFSRGTRHMINLAEEKGLIVTVINYVQLTGDKDTPYKGI